ncbi:hypothetical protein GFS60_01331 [Rhodococcus sp. WAY2]|nr:hypothetical protein GFS60_01331 [Rhodococcus sp. WAY2]
MGESSSPETTAAPIPVELQQFCLGVVAVVADHDPHDRPALLLRVAAVIPIFSASVRMLCPRPARR